MFNKWLALHKDWQRFPHFSIRRFIYIQHDEIHNVQGGGGGCSKSLIEFHHLPLDCSWSQYLFCCGSILCQLAVINWKFTFWALIDWEARVRPWQSRKPYTHLYLTEICSEVKFKKFYKQGPWSANELNVPRRQSSISPHNKWVLGRTWLVSKSPDNFVVAGDKKYLIQVPILLLE